MFNKWTATISILLAAILGISVISAQDSCDVDTQIVIETVSDVCAAIGDNEICYGNDQVNIVTRNADNLDFDAPGDLADIENVRSLYLSALLPEQNLWGIAQMNLLARTDIGTQPVNLLLFGDVSIENRVESAEVQIPIQVTANANVTVRSLPSTNGAFRLNAAPGQVLTANGRSANNEWVRVLLEDGTVGWIFASLIAPVEATDTLMMLNEATTDRPYFGPMQAFLYTQGGGSNCGNVMSDGLLIQTPQGNARVTLLINEVSIELIPTFENGATALVGVSADNQMSIRMLDGSADVTANRERVFINTTQQTRIQLNNTGTAAGTPMQASTFDPATMTVIPTLGIVRDPDRPIQIQTQAQTQAEGNNPNANNNPGQGHGRDNNPGRGNRPDVPPGLSNDPPGNRVGQSDD